MDIDTPPRLYSNLHFRTATERRFTVMCITWIIIGLVLLGGAGLAAGYFFLPERAVNGPKDGDTDSPSAPVIYQRSNFIIRPQTLTPFYNGLTISPTDFNQFLYTTYDSHSMLANPTSLTFLASNVLNNRNMMIDFLSSNYLLPVLEIYVSLLKTEPQAILTVTSDNDEDDINLSYEISYYVKEPTPGLAINDLVTQSFIYKFASPQFDQYAWVSSYNLQNSIFTNLKTLSAPIKYKNLLITNSYKVNSIARQSSTNVYPLTTDLRKSSFLWNENIHTEGDAAIFIPLVTSTFEISSVFTVDQANTAKLRNNTSPDDFNNTLWTSKFNKLDIVDEAYRKLIQNYAYDLEAKYDGKIKYSTTSGGFIDLVVAHTRFFSYPAVLQYNDNIELINKFAHDYTFMEAVEANKEIVALGSPGVPFETSTFRYAFKTEFDGNLCYLFDDGHNTELNTYVDVKFHPNVFSISGADNITVPIIGTKQQFAYELSDLHKGGWSFKNSDNMLNAYVSLEQNPTVPGKTLLTFNKLPNTILPTTDFSIVLANNGASKKINVTFFKTAVLYGPLEIEVDNNNLWTTHQYTAYGIPTGYKWEIDNVPYAYENYFSISENGLLTIKFTNIISFTGNFFIEIKYNNHTINTEIRLTANWGINSEYVDNQIHIDHTTFAESSTFVSAPFQYVGLFSNISSWTLTNISKVRYEGLVTASAEDELLTIVFNNATGKFYTVDSFTFNITLVSITGLIASKTVTVVINNGLKVNRADTDRAPGNTYMVENMELIAPGNEDVIGYAPIIGETPLGWDAPFYAIDFDTVAHGGTAVPKKLQELMSIDSATGVVSIINSPILSVWENRGIYSFSVYYTVEKIDAPYSVESEHKNMVLHLNVNTIQTTGPTNLTVDNNSIATAFNTTTNFVTHDTDVTWSIDSIIDRDTDLPTTKYNGIFSLPNTTAASIKIRIASNLLISKGFNDNLFIRLKCTSNANGGNYATFDYPIFVNCPNA